MLREIRLYGDLGRQFGKVHRFAVSSAAEAIKALAANFPTFNDYLRRNSEPGYHVWVGKQNLGESDLATYPTGERDVIKIAPVVAGAKKNGMVQTIFGAALAVIGALVYFFVPGGQPVGAFMMKIGAAIALGGVAQLLTPTPKTPAGQQAVENQPSYTFNGPVNTTAQGNPVPVCYGRMMVGSAVISAGITTEDIPV